MNILYSMGHARMYTWLVAVNAAAAGAASQVDELVVLTPTSSTSHTPAMTAAFPHGAFDGADPVLQDDPPSSRSSVVERWTCNPKTLGSIPWWGRVRNSFSVPPSQLLCVDLLVPDPLPLMCTVRHLPKFVRTLKIPYAPVVK